jgi:hypothetical protein
MHAVAIIFGESGKVKLSSENLVAPKTILLASGRIPKRGCIERSINCFETVFNQTHETTNRNQYLFFKYLKRQS